MFDASLQLVEDVAVKSVHLREHAQYLPQPVLPHHGLPIVPHCSLHGFSEVLQKERETGEDGTGEIGESGR